MSDFTLQSAYIGVVLSFATFLLGNALKNKYKLAIFNPILISVALCIAILSIAHIDYDTYNASAKYITWFLTPSTVCFAIPLYENLQVLKKNAAAVIAGIAAGVFTSLISTLVFAIAFALDHDMYVTMIPRNITTAIGMGLSEELAGQVNITVAVIVITGILGNMIGPFILRIVRVTEPVAKGVALGTASHAIGTSKAMELGEVEGAMGSLSIGVAGVLTVLAAMVFQLIY